MKTMLLPRRPAGEIERTRKTADREAVARILDRVKREGDAAVQAFALAFGDPVPRRIPASECRDALARLPADVRLALERMSERVRRFAQAQRSALREFSYESGGLIVGQRIVALRSLGVYVPAGRHPLPSTAVMTVVPAQVAGVARIALCTPRAADATLAACAMLGVAEVYEIGGAQAIAALAFGTRSIERVDKIAGPGNAYVNEAKRQVAGVCGIDVPAGPSEVAVIASRGADPAAIARSLLAEAEHDVDARAYLLTDEDALVAAVETELDAQASRLATRDVALAAIAASGAIMCDSIESCAAVANAMAIEHVELHGDAAAAARDLLETYGALFVGVPAAFGDYGAGPNHTLPTGSAARYAAGLSVYDYVAVRPFVQREALIDGALIDDCMALAQAEGLPAHRAALHAARRAGARE